MGLLEGIGIEVGGFSTNLALSTTGTLVYTTGSATRARQPVWVSREGLESPWTRAGSPEGIVASFAISPDPRSLAVELQQNGNGEIWVKQIPGGTVLAARPSATRRTCAPSWSAVTGRSLVYVGNAGTNGGHAHEPGAPTVPELPRSWCTQDSRSARCSETHDGRWLVLRRSLLEVGRATSTPVRTGDSTLVPLATSPATESDPAVSPDGRWVAYGSDESGVSEAYVRPFPECRLGAVAGLRRGGADGGGRIAAASCSTAAPPTRS